MVLLLAGAFVVLGGTSAAPEDPSQWLVGGGVVSLVAIVVALVRYVLHQSDGQLKKQAELLVAPLERRVADAEARVNATELREDRCRQANRLMFQLLDEHGVAVPREVWELLRND